MSKDNTTIELNANTFVKLYKKKLKESLDKDDYKRLNKIIKHHAKDTKKHFEVDGWDLDAACVVDAMMSEYFGSIYGDIDWYIQCRLIKDTKCVLESKKGKLMFTKEKKRGKKKSKR